MLIIIRNQNSKPYLLLYSIVWCYSVSRNTRLKITNEKKVKKITCKTERIYSYLDFFFCYQFVHIDIENWKFYLRYCSPSLKKTYIIHHLPINTGLKEHTPLLFITLLQKQRCHYQKHVISISSTHSDRKVPDNCWRCFLDSHDRICIVVRKLQICNVIYNKNSANRVSLSDVSKSTFFLKARQIFCRKWKSAIM